MRSLLNCVKQLNYLHQADPNKAYDEMQSIKARINVIKEKSYEGIKIRAKFDNIR